jgi:hypothetical protein
MASPVHTIDWKSRLFLVALPTQVSSFFEAGGKLLQCPKGLEPEH